MILNRVLKKVVPGTHLAEYKETFIIKNEVLSQTVTLSYLWEISPEHLEIFLGK